MALPNLADYPFYRERLEAGGRPAPWTLADLESYAAAHPGDPFAGRVIGEECGSRLLVGGGRTPRARPRSVAEGDSEYLIIIQIAPWDLRLSNHEQSDARRASGILPEANNLKVTIGRAG